MLYKEAPATLERNHSFCFQASWESWLLFLGVWEQTLRPLVAPCCTESAASKQGRIQENEQGGSYWEARRKFSVATPILFDYVCAPTQF